MEKSLSAGLAAVMVMILTGCGTQPASEQIQNLHVYSFSGQHELFRVTNGTAVLSEEYETLYGGVLEPNGQEFTDIVSYSASFSLSQGEQKQTLMVHAETDQTGPFALKEQELGQITGDVFRDDAAGKIGQELYFELQTTAQDGTIKTYQIPLQVKEITGQADNTISG